MTTSTRILTQDVRAKALELGFDKVGIARAEALTEEGRRLADWIGRGYHASMTWMETTKAKRADPRLHLPSAKSVICLAKNYFTPQRHQGGAGTGKVSRYAWGDDYHDVVGERLRELLAWLRERVPGLDAKIAVDSSPVMDKAWAERAGLGWIGKHSNLITPELGSWVFLGELIVDIELDPDSERVPDHCGTCTACIDACPTAAIIAPYVVDSNRCISFLTIELRDEELPLSTAGWVYGCDVCQDVCPWNRFETETSEHRFAPRPGSVDATLDDLVDMSPEEFAARFRKSPIKRAKIAGMSRNARRILADARSVPESAAG